VNRIKNIAVLGATGSIGRQSLDIIGAHPDRYHASVLAAGSRVDDLIALAKVHRPALAIIGRDDLYEKLHSELAPLGIETASGSKALADAAARDDVDMVLTATVGYSGLEPTIRAIAANKDIALANKETLVVAGAYIKQLLAKSKSRIYPVDSEHSAIYQCLVGEDRKAVKQLIITASGGPFRTWDRARIEQATAADALRHPNWDMGAKITIDSASMLNKAFEIIEARWLFDIEPERITAVVHPQSIVHSMVEFVDGAIKAQLGIPDMHLPIAYALGEASRIEAAEPPLTLERYASMTFEKPDIEKFPCLGFASEALTRGGNTACVINAANEIAVAAFLKDRIKFCDIYRIIRDSVDHMAFIADPTYEDYVATNLETRGYAESLIK
jgi:1-deoxy-D-xylulose-5-phosphate reductoisomerase